MKQLNKLDYNYQSPTSKPHDPTSFRIQASSISSYLDYTTQFFREKLLGESGFTGNTMSTSGTCVHYLAEQFMTNGTITEEDRQEVYAYINQEASDVVNPDEVRANITPMWAALKQHLLDSNWSGIAEPFVETPILPGITAGGSIDFLRSLDGTAPQSIDDLRGTLCEVVDYKTTSALTAPTKASRGYWFQALVYAYVLKQEYNITVNQFKLVFITKEQTGRVSEKTGKPLKDYPSTVSEVVTAITESDLELIAGVIQVAAQAIQAFVTTPSLRAIIAQDNRLANDTTVLPFTSISSPDQVEV